VHLLLTSRYFSITIPTEVWPYS